MKSQILKIPAAFLLLFLAACSNDLDLTDDWTDTPVVYSLLNPSSTTNFVRLQRAYLGEGNAYLMGQNSDSLYYDTNRVSVQLIRVKNNAALDTFQLAVTTSVEKAEGVFSEQPHFLYVCNSRLYPDSRYQLRVNRHRPVGSTSVQSSLTGVLDPSSAAQQYILLLKKQEFGDADLKDGNILHSLGFHVNSIQGSALYSITVSAAEVSSDCLDPNALPSFSNQLVSEQVQLINGWNDVFFKQAISPPATQAMAFRICISPASGTAAANLSATETPGCISWSSSAVCGNSIADGNENRRPIVRFGYSGNGIELRLTGSETELVYPFTSPTLAAGLNINLANSEPFKIRVTSSKNGTLHGIQVRFRYLERKITQPNYIEKSVYYSMPILTPATNNGGEQMEFLLNGDDFYQFLATRIPNDPTVYRPGIAVKLDFIFKVGTQAFYTYYLVNQPGNSIFNQPDFTNIENGKGIFTSRLDSTRANFSLGSASTDSLNMGRFTGNLFD